MKKIISSIIIICSLLSIGSINVFAETENDYSILQTLEIMVGDEDGDMRLSDKITRSEFTKVATTISSFRKSIPLSQKTSPFSDVPYKHWASAYIKAGVDNGIISGYPDSTFKPDNNVKYEEALTILLKILGYTDADFGVSYPYGQYALANNIDLTKDIDATLFSDLTRKQVADLLINALETNFKNGAGTPYNNFEATKMEDVVLLATTKEDASVPHDKVLTTTGTYKYKVAVDKYIGQKGTIVIKDGDTIIYFNPETKENIDKYVVYSPVSDGVVVYKDKQFSQIKIEDNTIAYYNNQPTTFATIKQGITLGDTISIAKTETNEIDYINVYKGNLDGPYIYSTTSNLIAKVPDINDYIILKKGNIITTEDIEKNDVFYLSKDLKIIMVYNTKITGVYNSATPNQEVPITVEISGNIYEIESGEAFQALSSTGLYKYGDTVTILLGKDKKIAGVISPNNVSTKTVGYISETGIKNYQTETKEDESKYYIKLTLPTGETIEYKAKKDYSSYLNSIVEVKFNGELIELTRINQDHYDNVGGIFNYENLSLGKTAISKNIQILDVETIDSNDAPKYIAVKPQRIDGVNLSSSNILYYETNEKNTITKLILKGVTNDYYEYGIVTKVDKTDSEIMLAASYKYNINGSELMFATQNKVFGVANGPAKFSFSGNNIDSMQNITKVNGNIKELTSNYITINSTHHLLADNVKVFYRNYDWDYMLISLDELLNSDEYKITGAYYDKKQNSGGRIRIITVSK